MRANTIQTLAAALRGRRVALGWSQAETAAVAGTSRKFVSEVEAGKETVELGKVLSLTDAMGLDINITIAVGEDGIQVDPEVLGLAARTPWSTRWKDSAPSSSSSTSSSRATAAANRTPRPSAAEGSAALRRPTRRSTPPPPTETGNLEDLLEEYLRGDDR